MIKECTNEMAIERADLLCLGLGSPECSREARAQLAYLLHLRDEFSLHEENRVSLYDPVFTTADIELLDCLKLDRLLENSASTSSIHPSYPSFVRRRTKAACRLVCSSHLLYIT